MASTVQVVTGTKETATAPAGGVNVNATASCPAGEVVTGGGASLAGSVTTQNVAI